MTALVGQGGRRGVAFLLSEGQREAVLAYCKIAAASGALLSIRDLVELLAIDATEEELQEGIASDESLSSKVYVESGLVALMSPGADVASAREAIEEGQRRRRRAISNIEAARVFARLFSKDAIFVAVAGTNSYLSVAEGDDIDYYCITRTDGMWAFMLKALLLSRVRSTIGRETPPFCFSYVMDERQVKDVSSRPMTAVHARDTLTSKVISRRRDLPRHIGERVLDEVVFPGLLRPQDEGDRHGAGAEPSREERVARLEFVALPHPRVVSLPQGVDPQQETGEAGKDRRRLQDLDRAGPPGVRVSKVCRAREDVSEPGEAVAASRAR